MKKYEIVYAQDVSHYGCVELEAEGDDQIVEAAKTYWKETDLDPADDPDWNNPVSKRIVQITDEAGNEIVADVRCDDYHLEYINDAEVDLRDSAAELLEMLERAQGCLERISDRLLYDEGQPVTFLEARQIEETYNDAICELAPIDTLIRKARGLQ